VREWQAIPSKGSSITLTTDSGKSGRALRMDFELPADFGYVMARKTFNLDLPSDYEFSFDIRGEAPINNLEFKLIDSLENVYWMKFNDWDFPTEWRTVKIRKRQIGYAWGPAPGLELRRVKQIEFAISKGTGGKGTVWIDNLSIEPIKHAVAIPRGYYPKYLANEQAFWTVIGVNRDDKEALVNEYGQIEVDRRRFSIEPFLFVNNKLVTWNDVTTTQSLLDGYLPIPEVQWNYKNEWTLTIQTVAAGVPGNSQFGAKYALERKEGSGKATLFIAIRPFQVNPPWQHSGETRIDSIKYENGLVWADEKLIIPMTKPSGFGAGELDAFYAFLAKGRLPKQQKWRDASGNTTAALRYDFDLSSGQTGEAYLMVPFYRWTGSPTPNMSSESARIYYDLMLSTTAGQWSGILDRIHISLPSSAPPIVNVLKSNLAYILINSDGPTLQPGSRNYERSWMRDGSLTSAALLQMGNPELVREFLDWYAQFQQPNGKIPAIVDARGVDPIDEHDSPGQFIYAVMQYFRFTHDTTWLRGKWDHVVKTVRYIQSLRAQRKTDLYHTGTPEQRACYGLVPESASHEGYLGNPKHSYWDDFFILRGLKDAAMIARILGERTLEEEFAAERDDFRKDFYASIRLAAEIKNIDYVPGCVELGDFDATSTTVGLDPAEELGSIPEPQLHNTFDRYWDYFTKRRANTIPWNDYTPYETRVIGSFIRLGQKQRALEALEYFMKDRRPAGWNHWAEVVHRDPKTPRYIGDMPHTWVGSDFIRSVRSMFVYERERDTALVIGAGIPEQWLNENGVTVKNLPTYYGSITLSMRLAGENVIAELTGNVQIPSSRIVLVPPREKELKTVRVNGALSSRWTQQEIIISTLPATVEMIY